MGIGSLAAESAASIGTIRQRAAARFRRTDRRKAGGPAFISGFTGQESDVRSKLTGTVLSATLAATALASAHAQNPIKPGKWEYTVTMQMPNMPQLPPGVQLPPNVQTQSGAGGMTVTHASCLNTGDPTAELRRPHGPSDSGEGQCKIERMQQSGGTVSWASTCTTPEASVHSEGTAHYNGDRMEANLTTRTTHGSGVPIQTSQHVVGHYVGPCDAR